MANNIDLTICALECPLGTFQCSGRLIFRKEYTVLFSPKRTTSRFASLTLRTPHRPPVSLCFSPKRTTSRFASLTLRTPHRSPVSLCFSGRLIFRLRAETFFQKIPVFRMAYFAQKSHRDFCSKTLMLQVRFAHPPNPAPSSRFFVLFSKAHELQIRFALPPNPAPLSRFFVLFSKTHDLQVRFALPPSAHRTPHRPPVSSPLAAAAD